MLVSMTGGHGPWRIAARRPLVWAVCLTAGAAACLLAVGCGDDEDDAREPRNYERREADDAARPVAADGPVAGDRRGVEPDGDEAPDAPRPETRPAIRPPVGVDVAPPPELVTSDRWDERYRYHSDAAIRPPAGADLGRARNVHVVDRVGEDGNIHREVRWPDDPGAAEPTPRMPVLDDGPAGETPLIDAPGSSHIHVEIDPELGRTRYAGLRFTTPCTLAVDRDGTLRAESEGIVGTDADGYAWESTELLHRGRRRVVFLRR